MSSSPKTLPPVFINTLLPYLKENYLKKGRPESPWNARDTEYFSRGIGELNQTFTVTRASKSQNYFNDPILRSGYLAYFLPVNAMKAYTVLSRFYKIPKSEELHIADIGAGPCSLSFGFLFLLADEIQKNPRRLLIHLDIYEQNRKIVNDGKALLQRYLKKTGLEEHVTVLTREFTTPFYSRISSKTKYDLLLLGNILNEFTEREQQTQLIQNILENLGKANTYALFLEPGAKKSSRDLQAVRDDVLDATDYHVVAPCLHQNQCPLNLTAKADWCHFQEAWQAPHFIQEFDRATGLKKTYLQYSYLLLNNVEANLPKYKPNEFIAITDLITIKDRRDLIGCGPSGRVRFIQSKNDASDLNQDFSRARRGTRFRVPSFKHNGEFSLEDKFSVTKKDSVETF